MIWVITSAERLNDEAAYINRLMTVADALLLRKPGWTANEYALLLEQVHPRHRNRIMIAEQADLVQEYGLMGLHLSERSRLASPPALLGRYATLGVSLSTSIHQLQCPGKMWHHLLLGPVFNSISKPGYAGMGDSMKDIPLNALAIGGVDATNVGKARAMGFSGAAVLGAVWQGNGDQVEIYQDIKAAWSNGK